MTTNQVLIESNLICKPKLNFCAEKKQSAHQNMYALTPMSRRMFNISLLSFYADLSDLIRIYSYNSPRCINDLCKLLVTYVVYVLYDVIFINTSKLNYFSI